MLPEITLLYDLVLRHTYTAIAFPRAWRREALRWQKSRRNGGPVAAIHIRPHANANATLDDTTLRRFLAGPPGFVLGTRMSISAANDAARQGRVAYPNAPEWNARQDIALPRQRGDLSGPF
jgi:hypothetical protein